MWWHEWDECVANAAGPGASVLSRDEIGTLSFSPVPSTLEIDRPDTQVVQGDGLQIRYSRVRIPLRPLNQRTPCGSPALAR